ncbi:tRNA methyltransferase [Conglomerata obtusa]
MNEDFEKKNVHSFYDKYSSDFSSTRVIPWPRTVKFLQNDFSLVLDAGCGNGRSAIHKHIISLDYSKQLLLHNPCYSKVSSDVLKLPFVNDSFGAVLSVAVIHHLSTGERRLSAVREMYRVLKPKGQALIYVWSRDVTIKKRFNKINGNDYVVTWNGNQEAVRYYYMFDNSEFEELLLQGGFIILESGKEQESLFAIVVKPE